MTNKELEQKCYLLAQTPQSRWFDLRYMAFFTMIQNSNLKMVNLTSILPDAARANFVGFCTKVESQYYFFLSYKINGNFEFFNVETMDFNNGLDFILSSRIVLSSDDDPTSRQTFLAALMSNMTKAEFKTKLDRLF